MRFNLLVVASLLGASVAAPAKRDANAGLTSLSSLFAKSVAGMKQQVTLFGLLEDVTSLIGLGNVVPALETATAGLDAELDDLTNVTAIIDEIHTLQMELARDLGLYDVLTKLGNDTGFFKYEAVFDEAVEALTAELKYFLGIKSGNGTNGLVDVVQALNVDVNALLAKLGVSEIDADLAAVISSLVDTLFNVPPQPPINNFSVQMKSQTSQINSAIAANSTADEIMVMAKSLNATVSSLAASL